MPMVGAVLAEDCQALNGVGVRPRSASSQPSRVVPPGACRVPVGAICGSDAGCG